MSLLRAEYRGAVASGSPTYNPFENPSTPLASVGFDNVWSTQNNDSGMSVTPDTASAVGTFYRCLFLLSSVVAGCPLEVYRVKDHECIPFPLFDPSNAETTYTPFEYMQLLMVYRLVWGNSYIFKKRDESDGIIDLKPLYPELVEPKMMDGEKVFLVKKMRDDGTIDETSKPQVFTSFEIMHIPGMGFDGLKGLPVVKLMSQSLGTTMAADKLAARFYSKGTQLGGIIKVKAPLRNRSQAEGIKRRWRELHAGLDNSSDVAVLDAETDFQDITIPPDQLQFLESRRWQTTEIARWFGVPPHLVGDVEKSTSWGSGIEQQNLGLDKYTLIGHITPVEQRHSREVVLTRGHCAHFDRDEMLRGSTLERYQALMIATGGPWQSVNETRQSENMQPKGPEYDDILPPQGIGPVGQQNGPTQKPQGNGVKNGN